jgi:formylglycine-generating enzyme required for sulfatase activity
LNDTGLEKGAQIGRYVIVESVGSGAMGVVYGAYDPELDRKVALKLLKPGHGAKETARERLLREAKAMARLQHPNVVAVHDVGVFEGRVFLAMEFLGAGTIKSWLAEKPRTWREIVKVFAAAGRGLAAAHAAGIVHRDFKPDNVLLDKDGRPRVVDFGIARESGVVESEIDQATNDIALEADARESSGGRPLLTLTKTGVLVGTPAYMAPEQFMGERSDERTDQFSFCVALYEALYGERPFAGDDMLSISLNVTQEQLRPLPRDRGVPAWVRRVIIRGLRADPSARWPTMAALITALERDPVTRRRRLATGWGTAVVLVATVAVAGQIIRGRHAQVEREIVKQLERARGSIAAAEAKATAARELRRRALAAYDGLNREEGDARWSEVRALIPAVDAGYEEAAQAFEAALIIDPGREQGHRQLADLRREHLYFAEEFRLDAKAQVLTARLADSEGPAKAHDVLGPAGKLSLQTTPPVSRAVLQVYGRDPVSGRRILSSSGSVDANGSATAIAPGSYRLILDGPGLARIVYPFEVGRGQQVNVELAIPRASDVPDGFSYVPPGEFWFGDGDEQMRTQFLDTVPIHRRRTGAYLIARHETTYADWISFLEALPSEEADRHLPGGSTAARGWVRLRKVDGDWQLAFQSTVNRYTAKLGEPIVYLGRPVLAKQDWSRFPVAGISSTEMNDYLSWLRATGRVPGARLCSELEWERAARGADDRTFPHGDDLHPSDANFDLTYGKVDSAYGPDVVGAHAGSRSPFDVDDLAGNVLELVTSSQKRDELVIRGGAFFFGTATARSTNRQAVPPSFRDFTTGLRVCASLPTGH